MHGSTNLKVCQFEYLWNEITDVNVIVIMKNQEIVRLKEKLKESIVKWNDK